ncbi:hypothetical protein CAPTEDRAFT_201976 [Capitella teleta]|uniref:Uncharacterized protein n=1 Tax=Capitella teleta TaxID=283909 RepID=R7V2J0_CAPTE|nr:hypothetical protein CAPTEDRAFT_201976 [Capitella teleta]|eukprot:ELU09926.1 hypothetical protein CAPTEDRAFT_201976 [Capitella teleta]
MDMQTDGECKGGCSRALKPSKRLITALLNNRWTRRLSSSLKMDSEDFATAFLSALQKPAIRDALGEILDGSCISFLAAVITYATSEYYSITTADDLSGLENVDPDLNFLPSIKSNILNYSNLPLNNSLLDTFSLLHSNVRSLSKHWNELISCLHLAVIKFTIIALTETWLYDTNAPLFSLPDYRSLHATRPCQRGGDISLYVWCDVDLKTRPDLDVFRQDIERLKVYLPKSNFPLMDNPHRRCL